MKRILFLFLAFCLSVTVFAQLEVKNGSFKEVPEFVNVNTEIMDDDNNVLYAIIKVKTENINDKQRHQLLFQGNAVTFIELEYHVGEVWVYLSSKPATYLKISHPDFGSTEFWFPFELKPKQGYEMVLVNTTVIASEVKYGTIDVSSVPIGASIFIDGKDFGKTPRILTNVLLGVHELRLEKTGYVTMTKAITFDETNKLTVDEKLQPGCEIPISTYGSGDKIFVDGNYVGTSPLTTTLSFSEHEIVAARGAVSTDYNVIKDSKDSQIVQRTITVSQNGGDSLAQLAFSGAVNGVFSVSSSDKVQFSQGNLQYQASTKTWRFAEHQWDYVGVTPTDENPKGGTVSGSSNLLISPDYDGWIDLFGWGTSGYINKNPWMISTENWHYAGEKDVAGTNYDWGVYNTISNGRGKNWRTLTKDEWEYVFEIRNTISGIRFVKATVNGVNGVILLPDDWNISNYSLTHLNENDAKFNSNIVSLSDWINKIEANGAVFLPTTGFRHYFNEIYVYSNGSIGSYWSASYYNSDVARDVAIDDNSLDVYGRVERKTGLGVRLVCPVENSAKEDLQSCREIFISTYGTGDKIFVDDNYVGTSPLITNLSFGEHNVKVERNGETVNKTVNISKIGGDTEVWLVFVECQTFIVNGVSFDMVLVNGGTFTMGATSEQKLYCGKDEKPAHSVTLSDYYIGKFEVTQELWQAVMGTTVRQQCDKANTSWKKSVEGNNYPMYYISWNECQEFITRLNRMTGKNFRLPTEAEWEYAARGGNMSRGYKYSGSTNIGKVGWFTDNSENSAHQVGTKAPNELGIYDMSGNVREWCQDWYGSYSSDDQTIQVNPLGPSSGSHRVIRGGSWGKDFGYCRVSYRSNALPDTRGNLLGFRLALVP